MEVSRAPGIARSPGHALFLLAQVSDDDDDDEDDDDDDDDDDADADDDDDDDDEVVTVMKLMTTKLIVITTTITSICVNTSGRHMVELECLVVLQRDLWGRWSDEGQILRGAQVRGVVLQRLKRRSQFVQHSDVSRLGPLIIILIIHWW